MAEELTAEGWRALLDGVADHTIGVEEELMLLDPDTLDLLPAAARVRAELGDRVSLRTELAAAQVETASPVCATIGEAAQALARARRTLAPGVAGWARLAGAGTHPFAAPEGALIDDPKYAELIAEFPWVLPRQLVFGLHVHVAVRGADRALAVHNALRSHLPDVAVLAGNAPLHGGRDTGLASLRPKLSELLPRQGVPPAWSLVGGARGVRELGRDAAASSPPPASPGTSCAPTTSTGRSSCACPTPRARPRRRPACSRSPPRSSRWLAERHDAGERLPVHDAARIEENRWRAMRHGLGGTLLDLDSGEPQPARERVLALIDAVAPTADRLGGAAELGHARHACRAQRRRAPARHGRPARDAPCCGVARGRVHAMKANVGARTSDRWRYVKRPRIGEALSV